MIIDIASLIYNQRNILKELKMTPPPMNFMKQWLSEPGGRKDKDEHAQNILLEEDSKRHHSDERNLEMIDLNT